MRAKRAHFVDGPLHGITRVEQEYPYHLACATLVQPGEGIIWAQDPGKPGEAPQALSWVEHSYLQTYVTDAGTAIYVKRSERSRP